MGIRASAQSIRYAFLKRDDHGDIVFVNRNTENRLKYPAYLETTDEKLSWVKAEIDRVIRQNPDIDRIIIKMNEFGQETLARRETTYVDAIIMLSAKENSIPIERRLNSQISSTATSAKQRAEQRVGKTDKYWDNAMADAILAAFWVIRQ